MCACVCVSVCLKDAKSAYDGLPVPPNVPRASAPPASQQQQAQSSQSMCVFVFFCSCCVCVRARCSDARQGPHQVWEISHVSQGTRTCTYTQYCTHTHPCVCTHTHTYTLRTHKRTDTHTRTHTRTHTHTRHMNSACRYPSKHAVNRGHIELPEYRSRPRGVEGRKGEGG